jgi:hypothetical protein
MVILATSLRPMGGVCIEEPISLMLVNKSHAFQANRLAISMLTMPAPYLYPQAKYYNAYTPN